MKTTQCPLKKKIPVNRSRPWLGISILILFIFALAGCRNRATSPTGNIPTTATPSPVNTVVDSTGTQPPATTTALSSTATELPPTASQTTTPTPLPPNPYQVRFLPDGTLYVGDLVSIEVLVPAENGDFGYGQTLTVAFPGEDDPVTADFAAPWGGAPYEVDLPWVWDTSDLEAGEHILTFSAVPRWGTWTQTVTLRSAVEIPSIERGARWAQAESDCCLYRYITGTPSELDLEVIMTAADRSAVYDSARLGVTLAEPVVITLIPRVYGHGGFGGPGEVFISYLDRNYVQHPLEDLFKHEMVHALDQPLQKGTRPGPLFTEGIAVYIAGGHNKPGGLLSLAAALLPPDQRQDGRGLDFYTPIQRLSENFYQQQHETSYIQAGALVAYMVETWGWERFLEFYLPPHAGNLDQVLQQKLSISIDELEQGFITFLQGQPVIQEQEDEMWYRVRLYDTIRRYQQALDPSAYFLTAWIPDIQAMQERGIVVDLMRSPSAVENIALETLLMVAQDAWMENQYAAMEETLAGINAVLDAMEMQAEQPFSVHLQAQAFYDVSRLLLELGYQAQRIEMEGDSALAQVRDGQDGLIPVQLVKDGGKWQVLPGE